VRDPWTKGRHMKQFLCAMTVLLTAGSLGCSSVGPQTSGPDRLHYADKIGDS
jgi:hypothetical protein